jgi:hypothetical protein
MTRVVIPAAAVVSADALRTSGRFGKVACDESVVGEDDRSGGEFGCVHRLEGADGC